MENEGIVGNAAIIGREMLVPGFTPLQAKHPMTGEIRGEGFFFACFAAEVRRRVEGMQIFVGGFEALVIEDLLQNLSGDAGVGHPPSARIFWATLLDGVAVPWLS